MSTYPSERFMIKPSKNEEPVKKPGMVPFGPIQEFNTEPVNDEEPADESAKFLIVELWNKKPVNKQRVYTKENPDEGCLPEVVEEDTFYVNTIRVPLGIIQVVRAPIRYGISGAQYFSLWFSNPK